MPKKSLRNRLMNYKYYYTHGLFDLTRRREKGVLERVTPSSLRTVPSDALVPQDSLILVSAIYPVASDVQEELIPLDEKNAIASMAEPSLRRLMAASEAACGEKILFTSTYRTLDFQASIFGVNPFAAKPGESEHHSGLCADIKVDGYAQRRFIMSKTGKWMARNAHRFGFVIRYPLWAEKRTGVDYEPWHLRYVGEPHAEILYRMKLCLEDYLAQFELGGFYRFGEYVISRQSGETLTFPWDGTQELFVSADTRGGRIIWGKAPAFLS